MTTYIPAGESASRRDRASIGDLNLDKVAFTVDSRWIRANGKRERIPKLNENINKLLELQNATIIDQPTENRKDDQQAEEENDDPAKTVQNKAVEKLHLKIEMKTADVNYSTFERVLFVATLGMFPAKIDRWYFVEAKVLDDQGNILGKGQFKALIRGYFGWGYWLADSAKGLIGNQPKALNPKFETSSDFYHFVARLSYSAAMDFQNQEIPDPDPALEQKQ